MASGFGEPGEYLSVPPSPSSQEDGGEKEPSQQVEVPQKIPEDNGLSYSPLGPSAESGSLGDTPLSPLIKSSMDDIGK